MIKRKLKPIGLLILAIPFGVAHSVHAVELAQQPLFLAQPAAPNVMLSMSVDHELFKKAYNDYSNLDGGVLTMEHTTYRNDFTYYGYFDPDWCYTYTSQSPASSSYFAPASAATNHVCSATGSSTTVGGWSGNFLNWATMARIDIVRQVLFGGKRSVDTATETILERAYLPKDIHAFVKVYEGTDTGNYTPYTNTQISLCSVSTDTNGYPVVRIAGGDWRQWSASESQQCQWRGESGVLTRPKSDSGATVTAKVRVCVADKDGPTSDRCKQYGSSPVTYKPVGVLQVHGESGKIKFGLVTGSYKANLKGGVLRKKAALIAGNEDDDDDEINLTTGQFNNVDGIISNINALRIAGYSFSSGNYTDCDTHSISIATVDSDTRASNRSCSDWGNPLAEIYLETLRYITGAGSASSGFDVDDSTAGANSDFPGISGLDRVASWGDPMASDEWCANCSVILLSTGSNSFDDDNLSTASDLDNIGSGVSSFTDRVGDIEFDTFAGSYFNGGTGTERHCTATNLNALSDVRGICPELPALEGTYHVAGLAYYAKTQDVRTDRTDKQTVKTYAVDLAESLPSFSIPVGDGEITFLPACEAAPGETWQGCSLIDVEVEDLVLADNKPVAGSYLFYWEDSLWGNDYDIDGAQRIAFCVGTACNDADIESNEIKLINSVPYAFAGNNLRFSYTITGTSNSDGLVTPWAVRPGQCDRDGDGDNEGCNYDALDDANDIPDDVESIVSSFSPGTATATLLKKPLYYAAKYGGFNDLDEDGTPENTAGDAREWDVENNLTGAEIPDGVPDNYFDVKNPAQLEASLDQVLRSIVGDTASGSAAAANSTRLGEGTVMYQAKFSSLDWSGELVAVNLDEEDGSIQGQLWSTKDNTISSASRRVYTYNGTSGVAFTTANWSLLSDAQRTALKGGGSDDLGKSRINWIRGQAVEGMREREHWLGDIINSDPVFAGRKNFYFNRLSAELGGEEYADYYNDTKKTRRQVIYVNANDGMLHAFDANTGEELFTYIPSMVYDKLRNLTAFDYGTGANSHHYVVDGPLFVGDAYINNQWRNILVGTLGAGGRGIFVLDVTNPDSINASNLVLFELTAANYPQLGHVLGQPIIAPVGDSWKIIFGNGYNSDDDEASLFVIDLESPLSETESEVIATTDSAIANGLAAPALTVSGFGDIVSAYAGDLAGNMWKFDLYGTGVGDWGLEYKLFSAKDDSNNAQPITAAPILGTNSFISGSTMVYFGTGKYFDVVDNDDTGTVQSFYALADRGVAIGESGSSRTTSLHEKTIGSESGGVRTIAGETTTTNGVMQSAVDWTTKKGWFLDFSSATSQGERVTSKPLLLYDRLIFPTLIPSTEPCEFGGSGWLMELIAVGDRSLTYSLLGESGLELEYAVLGLSTVIRSSEKVFIPYSNIAGDAGGAGGEPPIGEYGRMSWRQLQ